MQITGLCNYQGVCNYQGLCKDYAINRIMQITVYLTWIIWDLTVNGQQSDQRWDLSFY